MSQLKGCVWILELLASTYKQATRVSCNSGAKVLHVVVRLQHEWHDARINRLAERGQNHVVGDALTNDTVLMHGTHEMICKVTPRIPLEAIEHNVT